MRLRKFIKTWILVIAMAVGMVFHDYIGAVKFITPWLIFVMLFITYTKINLREIKIGGLHLSLLAVQLLLSWIVYFALVWWNRDVACGAFMCVFISTATGAPVITSLLGGSIAVLVSYSLLSNLMFATCAPLFLSIISDSSKISFIDSFLLICMEVLPMLLAPLALAVVCRKVLPKQTKYVSEHQSISFYIWATALIIVIGNAVSFAMQQPAKDKLLMAVLAVVALCVCCTQFIIGRKLGGRYGDKVAGAQGLGQKNTVLAIWVSMTYLHPIISLAPAAYVLWQNLINSAQLWYHGRKEK